LGIVAEPPQLPLVVAPVFADFDEELQEDLLPEELLQLLAGLPSDLFEFLALVPDEDSLLRVARHVDHGRNAVDAGLLAVLLDLDFAAVRDLLVVVAQDLFADDLRGEETQRLVRERILRVEGFAFGQQRQNPVEQAGDVESFPGRDRYDFGVGQRRAPLLDERFERLLRRQVDLVDHHQRRHSALADAVDDLGRTFVVPLDGVGHVEQHVGVRQGAAHEIHHRLLQLVTGFQDARRIGEDDLEIVAVDDAQNAVARGLRLGGDDGEFLAHQCVHQRRLPDVGISDDIDKARFVHEMRFIRVQSYDKFEKIPYVCKSYSLKSYCLWRNNGDISGCRRSFLRKSRADGRIESFFMCRHRTKSAGTKHIKSVSFTLVFRNLENVVRYIYYMLYISII